MCVDVTGERVDVSVDGECWWWVLMCVDERGGERGGEWSGGEKGGQRLDLAIGPCHPQIM